MVNFAAIYVYIMFMNGILNCIWCSEATGNWAHSPVSEEQMAYGLWYQYKCDRIMYSAQLNILGQIYYMSMCSIHFDPVWF